MARPKLTLAMVALILTLISPPGHADEGIGHNPPHSLYTLIGSNPELLKAALKRTGGVLIHRLRYHSGWVVSLSPHQAMQLKTTLMFRGPRGDIGSLEPDVPVKMADSTVVDKSVDNEKLSREQTTPWGLKAIHAPEAFETAQGKGVTVCVIDTGVDADHPDLARNIIGGENTLDSSDQSSSNWDDDNGHGTHVSGTIAALDNGFGVVGVAPQAKIFAVKALDSEGNGTLSSLGEGIRSCMAHGAKVISMSLAYSAETEFIRKAINDALAKGIILVAAAGNNHSGVMYPARDPGVIAVSALDPNLKLAWFSNYGPEISFAAPGVNVLSTWPGGKYMYMRGTSQATPHVSGVAALLLSDGLSRNRMRGDDVGLRSDEEGHGCIDAVKSLAAQLW